MAAWFFINAEESDGSIVSGLAVVGLGFFELRLHEARFIIVNIFFAGLDAVELVEN